MKQQCEVIKTTTLFAMNKLMLSICDCLNKTNLYSLLMLQYLIYRHQNIAYITDIDRGMASEWREKLGYF